jgi:small subunit ribosomal protein S17
MKDRALSSRSLTGIVVSDKMAKTLVVEVTRTYIHDQYDRVLRSKKRYKAHYEGDAKIAVGDTVQISEGRPVSKTKYMYVTNVVTQRGPV